MNTNEEIAAIIKKIDAFVLTSLKDHLVAKHKTVTQLPEMKDVTIEDLVTDWNSISQYKISPDEINEAMSKPSPKQRVKTDKGKKCKELRKKGSNKGEPCGKNCVLGSDYCSGHSGKNTVETTTVSDTVTDEVKTSEGCEHTLENGPRKGTPCGGKVKVTNSNGSWCTVHGKKHA